MKAFSDGVLEKQFAEIIGCKISWNELFSILDHDNNGQISFQEFLTGACNKSELINDETLIAAFNILDTDEDGYLDLEEFKRRFS